MNWMGLIVPVTLVDIIERLIEWKLMALLQWQSRILLTSYTRLREMDDGDTRKTMTVLYSVKHEGSWVVN